jgi:hypothetical protein
MPKKYSGRKDSMIKYLGTYNLSVPYDIRKNEFNKNNKHDIRIDCKKGFICRYNDTTLKSCFENQVVKGNVLKVLSPEMIVDANFNYYDFTFYEQYISDVAQAMGVLTNHKNRNPYSIKNLPTYGKYVPRNPELCAEFSKMLSQKYEMHEVRKTLTEYFQKYSIPIERGIKQIHLLDKHDKLQAAYEEEKMKGEHK